MKSLKKQRRIQVIAVAAVALVLSTVLIGYAMRDGINFFRAPSQIIAEPPGPKEVFRIGGLVEEGSLKRGVGDVISFSVTDGGASIPVTFTGVLPDLFREGQGIVANGTLVSRTRFEAEEVLAKHDETYMPPEVAEALEAAGKMDQPHPGGKAL